MSQDVTRSEVHKILENLRDAPVDTNGLTETTLHTIYEYLMSATPKSCFIVFHWFCTEANPTTIEAATFLLRLLAYDQEKVEEWKNNLNLCLSRCAECVLGLEKAKVMSMDTYLGAFRDDIKHKFITSFENWELDCILQQSGGSLSSAPPAVVYRIVFNVKFLQDERIHALFQKPPPAAFTEWPTNPLPPGLLLLFMHENSDVRNWALQQAKSSSAPIPDEKQHSQHKLALEFILNSLSSIVNNATEVSNPKFPFARDTSTIWQTFWHVPHYLPLKLLLGVTSIRRFVAGHLHDTGSGFVLVFRSFLILLKRMSDKLWDDEIPDYPRVIFDALKDNTSFINLILNEGATASNPWFLSWFSAYLRSINDQRVHSEVLAKMADFLFEELQHERFGEVRPIAALAATRMLSSRWRSPTAREPISRAMDIHADVLVAIALSRSHNNSNWKNTRSASRDLIDLTRTTDITQISETLNQLLHAHATVMRKKDSTQLPAYNVPPLHLHSQFWRKAYDSVECDDPDAVTRIVAIAAQASPFDTINLSSFKVSSTSSELQTYRTAMQSTVREINQALEVLVDGFLEAVTRFADKNMSSSMLEFLQLPGVGQNLIKMMLSPVEGFQDGAKVLIGATFDVDLRMDCFRSLFENLPDASFDGLFEYLSTFVDYATKATEACSLSKSLVRCLTDIIQVLCASDNGLLHTAIFLRSTEDKGPASRILELWTLMTKAIAIIFKRTPSWSIYFDSQGMIIWMRDALIFGRDMLAERRVFQTAAMSNTSHSISSPEKTSRIEKEMVIALEEVLFTLCSWLRLTDEELLHQSFALLQSLLDCFRISRVPLPTNAVEKLNRHIADARNKEDPTRHTRLDSTRLIMLENALASFKDDDDVEITWSNVVPNKTRSSAEDDEVIILSDPAPKKKPPAHTGLQEKRKALKEGPRRKDSVSTTGKKSHSKTGLSRFFTEQDQQKLDGDRTIASFRRTGPMATHKPSDRHEGSKPVHEAASTVLGRETDSSDSGSDEDESQVPRLSSLLQAQKSPKIKKSTERRQVQMLHIPTTKNPMEERIKQREAARREALRLKPDISGLHRAILSWDYDCAGDIPPGFEPRLQNIPDEFANYRQYYDVFHPLLLLEAWKQLQQSKEEKSDCFECSITGRTWDGHWLVFEAKISGSLPNNWYLSETDVVILRHPDGKKKVVAKVEGYRTSPTTIDASLRSIFPSGYEPGLHIGTSWTLSKVLSLSTLHREYAALMALDYYDYRDTILQPRLSKPLDVEQSKIDRTIAKYNVNRPQAVAICNALETQGFVLIQGPPGTGKSSTICGLISAFLTTRAVNIVPGKVNPDVGAAPKVLLCAPSNAAIDEIATRLMEQLHSPEQSRVVRVGAESAMNHSVKTISLDYLVDQVLKPDETAVKEQQIQITAQKAELESVKREIEKTEKELKAVSDNQARTKVLEDEIRSLKDKRTMISKQLQRMIQERTSDWRTLDAARRKARLDTLRKADVVCSTLSGAGHEMLDQLDFDMVIIDEAAQAIELSSLIPLKYSCKRCIMVGDPQQLPPTVLSLEACKYRYNQSLFVRLQRQQPDAVHLLSIQYRMHPDISQLPSDLFYNGKLRDGPDMANKTVKPWHQHVMFGTYKFLNVSEGNEEKSGRSIRNRSECDVAMALYTRLSQEFRNADFKIGIVSMYRAQVTEIRRLFEQRFGRDVLTTVDFNTVDGFQGQEKDVIILSCVRAGPGLQNVGFLSDVRRMNVALTRAKSSIFILGHAATLERSDATWKKIVDDARRRQVLIDIDPSYFTRPTSAVQAAVSVKTTSPRKSTKLATKPPSMSVPSDLTTPRDFVKSKSKKDPETTPNVDTTDMASSSHPSAPKRKLSQEDEPSPRPRPPPPPLQAASRQATSSRPPGQETRLPQKRRHQEPNLFIPKKKNKR